MSKITMQPPSFAPGAVIKDQGGQASPLSAQSLCWREMDEVWVLSADTDCPAGFDSDAALSIPFRPDLSQGFMADYMRCAYWATPAFGDEPEAIPGRTQFLLWRQGDQWQGLYPIAGGTWMARLRGDENAVWLDVFTGKAGHTKCSADICLYAADTDPYRLMTLFAEAGEMLSPIHVRTRRGRRYPALFEKVGWCSWDAMDVTVNTADVVRKAREFKDKGLPVGWFILDDMWADVRELTDLKTRHKTRLTSFGPDPARFPGGLAPLTRQLREEFDVETGVWYTVQGYWAGIDPEGPIAQELADDLTAHETTPHGGEVRTVLEPTPKADAHAHFHDRFGESLRRDGITFVKVDNQSGQETMWRGQADIPAVARALHEGLEQAVGRHFDMNLINCMGMALQDLWNRPTSAINRNSGDFLPENPASFNRHAVQNAYNSFTVGEILWPDWDMWWTDELHGVKSGVLRGISGGPVYLSDKLDRTRADRVFPLILSDGTILRFQQPGVPTADILLSDPVTEPVPLKIINRWGDTGAMAVYNACQDEAPMDITVSPSDIPWLTGERFAVYEYFTGETRILDRDETWTLTLAPEEVLAFSLCPVREGMAPIGLHGKYFPCVTVGGWQAGPEALSLTVRDGGDLLLYSETVPSKVLCGGQTVEAVSCGKLLSISLAGKGPQRITIIK